MHEEFVDLLVGKDGSAVIRHIRGGEEEARHILRHYFGDLPDEKFRHPPIWDWIRLEAGTVPREKLKEIAARGEEQTIARETADGSRPVTVRVHEVEETPHFDLPRYRMTQSHTGGRKWKAPVAILVVVALAVIGAKLRMGQGPAYKAATFDTVLAALQTPAKPPNLIDQFRRDDGEHFAVNLGGNDILQAMGNGIFLQSAGGQAWFLEGPGLGNEARNLMQNRQALEVETTQGPSGPPRFASGGAFVPFRMRPVVLEQPQGGYVPVKGNDPNDPPSLEVGKPYAIEGGLKVTGNGVLLYTPSFAQVKYITRIDGVSDEMKDVLRHATDNSLMVAAYGTVTQVLPRPNRGTTYISPTSEEPTTVMKPEILRLSRRVFLKF